MNLVKTVRASARSSKRVKGFTALEALLATAILAFVTAAVSSALMAGRMQARMASDTMHASMLGHALLDEVTRLPVAEPGEIFQPKARFASSGGTVAAFNCAPDYNGYNDGPGNLTDLAKNPYPDAYQPYSRSVRVIQQTYSPVGWGISLKPYLVTVTVSRDGQQLVTLQRAACN